MEGFQIGIEGSTHSQFRRWKHDLLLFPFFAFVEIRSLLVSTHENWRAGHYSVTGRVDGESYGTGLGNDRVYSSATGGLSRAERINAQLAY